MVEAIPVRGVQLVVIDPAAARNHVMRPQYAVGATSNSETADDLVVKDLNVLLFPSDLDVSAFESSLHVALKDCVAGYVMQLRQGGKPMCSLEWAWAKTPEDGHQSWRLDVPMHIASCSKLVTAMAMTKLLAHKGIDPTTPIAPYLPAYWHQGPNVDKITFQNLLTHTSGLNYGPNGASDYVFMKDQIDAGTSHLGNYSYQNVNFALCRILITTIAGNTSVGGVVLTPGFEGDDTLWDYATIQGYLAYVDDNILSPAGVSGAGPQHPGGAALAYDFPVTESGWNSGELSSVLGGAGWHMTCTDLLDVMSSFRRHTLLSPANAQTMLDAGYGIDGQLSTPLGSGYFKTGEWHRGSRFEQCLAYFLPDDMELAVFTNSTITTSPAVSFQRVVTSVYLEALGQLKPAASTPGGDRLDVFGRGGSDFYHQTWDGSAWSGDWVSRGGPFTSGPASCSCDANRIDLFGRKIDNAIWHTWSDGFSWRTWGSLGGEFTSGPAAATWGPNRIDVFGRGADYAIWHTYWDGSTWSGWRSIGGLFTSDPAVAAWGPDRLDVFAIDPDGHLWHQYWDGTQWRTWENLRGKFTSNPAVASWGPHRLDVFTLDTGGSIQHIYWDGTIWHSPKPIGNNFVAGPAAVSRGPGRIDVFAKATDSKMKRFWWDGSTWSGPEDHGYVGV
jgi:CubicO group peptidase (beta-lactamase class C family)